MDDCRVKIQCPLQEVQTPLQIAALPLTQSEPNLLTQNALHLLVTSTNFLIRIYPVTLEMTLETETLSNLTLQEDMALSETTRILDAMIDQAAAVQEIHLILETAQRISFLRLQDLEMTDQLITAVIEEALS